MQYGQSGRRPQLSDSANDLLVKKIIFFFKLFPKRQILHSSKLKEFADNNSNFDENGRTFSKQVENTVEKREITRYEQFLLFPQCFQKTCPADT